MRTAEDAAGRIDSLWSYQRYLSLYANSYIAKYHEHRYNADSLYVPRMFHTSRVSVLGTGPSSGLPFALRRLFEMILTQVDGFRAGRL